MKLTLILTLALCSNLAFAGELQQPKLGLWERFCINNKIGDACGKAVKSLSEKIAVAGPEEAGALKTRLQTTAQLGCTLNNKISCARMIDTTSAPADALAHQDLDEE